MLQQLLSSILEGQAGTQRQLAQRFEVPEALVVQMIDQLVARGYLKEATLCAEGCHGCARQAACGSDRKLRLWSLTDKGRRAAAE
jgi:predicted ArsR family transcriptional regulator